jgi:hypothetical protein
MAIVARLVGVCIVLDTILFNLTRNTALQLRDFLDPGSITWLVGLIVGGLCIAFDPRIVFEAMVSSTVPTGPLPPERRRQYVRVFDRAYALAWSAGLSWMAVNLIVMLVTMRDPASIGPAAAVAALPLLHGILLAEFFIAPLSDSVSSAPTTSEAADAPTLIISTRAAVYFTLAACCFLAAIALNAYLQTAELGVRIPWYAR